MLAVLSRPLCFCQRLLPLFVLMVALWVRPRAEEGIDKALAVFSYRTRRSGRGRAWGFCRRARLRACLRILISRDWCGPRLAERQRVGMSRLLSRTGTGGRRRSVRWSRGSGQGPGADGRCWCGSGPGGGPALLLRGGLRLVIAIAVAAISSGIPLFRASCERQYSIAGQHISM